MPAAWQSEDGAMRPDTTLLLCRGCCCGTTAKHPRIDHDAQVEALEDAVAQAPGVELRVVDCLDECDRSNVAVVRRSGGRPAERDTWLGGLLTERATRELAAWLADGAQARLPPAVAGLRFRHVAPRRRAR
jgi:predicted metal-binding protein